MATIADLTMSDILEIQNRLNVYGAKLKPDGVFGPNSTLALIAFQKQFGLIADGIYGPETEKALFKGVMQPMPDTGVVPLVFTSTVDQFQKALKTTPQIASLWFPAMMQAMRKYGITNPKDACCFLAQIGHETAGLTILVENLNYSAEGLAQTWPSRYAIRGADGKPQLFQDNTTDTTKPARRYYKPNDLGLKLQRNPQAIANNCYANRMGNGDEASGDGWKYRAQGPIQATGKFNIGKIGAALGVDLLTRPEQLQLAAIGSESAAYFWNVNGVSKYGKIVDIDGVSDAVNIGRQTTPVGDAVGYQDRRARTLNALSIYGIK